MSAHRSTHRIVLVCEGTEGGVGKRQFAIGRMVERLVDLYPGEDVGDGSETRNAA